MRFLTSAAVALALTGAAAAAHADNPQQPKQGQQHQGDQPHGGQPAGQPHGQGAGQPHGQGQAGGQGAGRGGQAHFQGPAGGGQHNFAGAQGGGPQGGGQPRYGQGQGGQHFNPQAGQGGQAWQGQGGQHGQPNNQVQRWNDQGPGPQGGQHWNGQGPGPQGGARGGFGFQNHALRGRDQGRVYYNAGAFGRQYQAQRRFRFGGYRSWPSGWYLQSWNYGDFLPYGWFASQFYLNWADYGLPPPPIGCEWIAQGPDAVLVDVWTGEVLSVVRGAFYWNGY